MKIVCTAFVLMLAASYGCATDDLPPQDDAASIVAGLDTAVEDVSSVGEPDVVTSNDVTDRNLNEDAVAVEDVLVLEGEDIFLSEENDAESTMDRDPTSFFTPAFQYVPSEPF